MTSLPEDRSTGLDPASPIEGSTEGIKGESMSNTVPNTRPTDEDDVWPDALTCTFLPVKGFTVGSADTFLPPDDTREAGVMMAVHLDVPGLCTTHPYFIPLPLMWSLMERAADVIAREMEV